MPRDCMICGVALSNGNCPNRHEEQEFQETKLQEFQETKLQESQCAFCKTNLDDGKCPNGHDEQGTKCPHCAVFYAIDNTYLVDGKCPFGHDAQGSKCPYCNEDSPYSYLRFGKCRQGHDEFGTKCAYCKTYLKDGECPYEHDPNKSPEEQGPFCSCDDLCCMNDCPKSFLWT